jgi:tRNA-dihydrouridine synthase
MEIAARVCAEIGYDEININCGCPSSTVASVNAFGAALMREAVVVQELAAAARRGAGVGIEVTVKHRLGVDECDSWEDLVNFVKICSAPPASVRVFCVHARKALLGLTTIANRQVPPLKHSWVFRLVQAFPHLSFELNGAVATLDEAKVLLETPVSCSAACSDCSAWCQDCCRAYGTAKAGHLGDGVMGAAKLDSVVTPNDSRGAVQGRAEDVLTLKSDLCTGNGDGGIHPSSGISACMVGRGAFFFPWQFADADRRFFGSKNPGASRRQVIASYVDYAEQVPHTCIPHDAGF